MRGWWFATASTQPRTDLTDDLGGVAAAPVLRREEGDPAARALSSKS